MSNLYENWLNELTSLPTAAGCEQRVLDWITGWAKKRKNITLKNDRFGNLLLQRRGVRSEKPIIFTAHADHPAFVVDRVINNQDVEAAFRGGVEDRYFLSGPPRIVLHHKDGATGGVITAFRPASKGVDKGARMELEQPCQPQIGDVAVWAVGKPRIWEDRFEALACDDLAGLAAGLSAFDLILKSRAKHKPDVRLLITRAEEIGFVGAIGACKSELLPKRARIINLECSKSFAESPIGAGPIVRVGDRTCIFDPELIYRIGQIAQQLTEMDPEFRYQRKLMPGGTCEASAFSAYGFAATCLCLPLGNYHNMNEQTGSIDAEHIDLRDFHHLITLLVEVGHQLGDESTVPTLRPKLEARFQSFRHLID